MSVSAATCLAGVDVGKSNLRVALWDGAARELTPVKQPYDKAAGNLLESIAAGIDAALAQAGLARESLAAIGVTVPAVVDQTSGRVVWGPDFEALEGASVTAWLGNEFGVPVAVDTDSTAATLGELWRGQGQTCEKFAVITWGTGIGAGLVLHGTVYREGNLFAEFGHSIVSDDEEICICGSRGCLGALVSGPAIARQTQQIAAQQPGSLVAQLAGGKPEQATSFTCFEAARRGDAAAKSLLERVGVLFGRLCANLVYTIQPQRIVFVGGLSDQLDAVHATIDRTMREGCWLLRQGLTECEILASDLRDTAGVWGAIRGAQLLCGEEAPR